MPPNDEDAVKREWTTSIEKSTSYAGAQSARASSKPFSALR